MASYSTTVKRNDHFQPDSSNDPATQRKLRGQLEQIDYMAYACNKEVLGQAIGMVDVETFQKMAVVTAHARALWVAEAISIANSGMAPSPERSQRLGALHRSFEECSDAYEAMRRMVERGYLGLRSDKR